MAITDYIQTADTVLEALAQQLQGNVAGMGVYTFSGTTYQALFEKLPTVNTPAAVLVWQGAALNREPGRPERIYHSIMVLLLSQDGDTEAGAKAARAMVYDVLRLLDDYTTGDIWCRCMDVAAVDLTDQGAAPTVSCYAVTLEVSDH